MRFCPIAHSLGFITAANCRCFYAKVGHEGDFAASLLPHHLQEKLKPPCENQNTFGMQESNKGPCVRMKEQPSPSSGWDVELSAMQEKTPLTEGEKSLSFCYTIDLHRIHFDLLLD